MKITLCCRIRIRPASAFPILYEIVWIFASSKFVNYMMHGLKILGRRISIWSRCWRSFAIWRACSWYVCYSLHHLSCAKISHCQTDFLDLATWMQPTVLFVLWDKMLQTGISSNPQVLNFHELNLKNFKI